MLHFVVCKVTIELSSKRASVHFVTHLSIWKATDDAVLKR